MELSSIWKGVEASLSSLIYDVLIPLVSRCSCRSLKTRMNLLSGIALMGKIKILFLSHSYNTNRYLFQSVSICLLWSIILANTVLVRYNSGFIGGSSSFIGSCCLVDLMFLLVWCMWTLAVYIDGGICLLIRLIVKFVHISK